MANSKLDENSRPTIICASLLDGITIVPIEANPSTHKIIVEDNTTGSDAGNNSNNAMLDQNSIPVFTALSSSDDGSIIEIYGDASTGAMLIDSN